MKKTCSPAAPPKPEKTPPSRRRPSDALGYFARDRAFVRLLALVIIKLPRLLASAVAAMYLLLHLPGALRSAWTEVPAALSGLGAPGGNRTHI